MQGDMGHAAALAATTHIKTAIEKKGVANIILATGSSQLDMLENLTAAQDIDWTKVVMFHLDEYVGLPMEHPASFRRYLKERFVDRVSELKGVHFVNGNAPEPEVECDRLATIIKQNAIDVAMVGIGENGHLAFNDPPADFETRQPYILVKLDRRCREQQLREGWFKTLEEVPAQAISMSVQQIMQSRAIVVTVPGRRKAKAVKNTLESPVTNMVPASILQKHPNCRIYLDSQSASLLSKHG